MDKHKSQHGSFSSLLSSLFQQGLKSPPPVHAYSWMTGGRLLSTERELAAITKSMKGDFGPALMPIASPNANKFSNWLIAIWAGWDFESENPSAKIEVSYVQGYGKAFHFRFESPHRGRHEESSWKTKLGNSIWDKIAAPLERRGSDWRRGQSKHSRSPQ